MMLQEESTFCTSLCSEIQQFGRGGQIPEKRLTYKIYSRRNRQPKVFIANKYLDMQLKPPNKKL